MGRLLRLSKTPSGFSANFLQSAARTPCAPMAHNSHTCSLRSIFRQAHVLTENDSDFIRRCCGELCEAFLTRWEACPMGRLLLFIIAMIVYVTVLRW